MYWVIKQGALYWPYDPERSAGLRHPLHVAGCVAPWAPERGLARRWHSKEEAFQARDLHHLHHPCGAKVYRVFVTKGPGLAKCHIQSVPTDAQMARGLTPTETRGMASACPDCLGPLTEYMDPSGAVECDNCGWAGDTNG